MTLLFVYSFACLACLPLLVTTADAHSLTGMEISLMSLFLKQCWFATSLLQQIKKAEIEAEHFIDEA